MQTTNPVTGSLLVIDHSGHVLTLTLNRPEKMNALNAPLIDALLAAVTAAYSDGTRVLVFQGSGRNFSAGFDFSDYENQSEGDLLLRFVRIEQLLQAVYHAPYETIALAHGKNFGAGVDLVCACARRFAEPDSTFRMPGLRFGLVLGTRRFAQRVGETGARAILQASKTFDAQEALAIGFLEGIAPREQWARIVNDVADCATRLSVEAASALHRCTTTDSRMADMADLVQSASAPGIKERIRLYLAEHKQQ